MDYYNIDDLLTQELRDLDIPLVPSPKTGDGSSDKRILIELGTLVMKTTKSPTIAKINVLTQERSKWHSDIWISRP